MCVQGAVWIEPNKHLSMLHVGGQAPYVEGVYAVVSWGRPCVYVCVEVSVGADWDEPRLFKDNATWSGLGRGGEEAWNQSVRATKKKAARETAPSRLQPW